MKQSSHDIHKELRKVAEAVENLSAKLKPSAQPSSAKTSASRSLESKRR